MSAGFHFFDLKINGKAMPVQTPFRSISVRFTESLKSMDALEMTVTEAPAHEASLGSVKLGMPYALALGSKSPKKFEGVVVSIDHLLRGGQRTLVLRGVNGFVKLRGKRQTKVYEDLNIKDIIGQVASNNGLSADVTLPAIKVAREFQDNVTDADYLVRLATRYGCYVRVEEGKKLRFAPLAKAAGGKAVEATVGSNVQAARLSFGVSGIATKVSFTRWDNLTDADIEGQSTGSALSKLSGGKDGGAHYKANLGANEVLLDNADIAIAADGKAQAEALHQISALGYLQGTITLSGDPAAVAGSLIDLKGAGDLDGKYLIVESTHHLDGQGNYTTQVQVVSDSGT